MGQKRFSAKSGLLIAACIGISLGGMVMGASLLRYRGYRLADRLCDASGACGQPRLVAGGLILASLALLLIRIRSTVSTVKTGGIIPR